MQRRRIGTEIFCLLAVAAILLASAQMLPERREPVPQVEKEASRSEGAFQGTVKVWHISQWRTGGVSMSALLNQVLDWLEKRHPGTYFTLETLDADTARSRLAQGEQPDILSFPGGMTLPCSGTWQTLSCEGLSSCYREILGESSFYLPWIASDAKVMIRESALSDRDASVPTDDWTWEDMIRLSGALTYETQGKRARRFYGITAGQGRWPLLTFWRISEEALLPGEYTERTAWDQLVEGNVHMLLVGPWEEMTLSWRQEAGKGPQVLIRDWPWELPRLRSIQWIGAMQSGDEQKDALCAEVVSGLLSAKIQEKIPEKTGCLACRAEQEQDEGAILYMVPNSLPSLRGTWGDGPLPSSSGFYIWSKEERGVERTAEKLYNREDSLGNGA